MSSNTPLIKFLPHPLTPSPSHPLTPSIFVKVIQPDTRSEAIGYFFTQREKGILT